jgi:RNA polymerase sigma-70 factor, ECF subfamily
MTETTRLDFTLFYDQHVERIYRYLLVRLGAPADAEDLTAETFRAALEGFARVRSEDSAAAWLVGIARHKLVDHFRRRKPVVSLEDAAERPQPGPTVEEVAAQRLDMTRVSRVLAQLNRDRAEALALHYFAGLNLAEVGEAMGKSEEAAKKLVQRGLEELRQRLVSECP